MLEMSHLQFTRNIRISYLFPGLGVVNTGTQNSRGLKLTVGIGATRVGRKSGEMAMEESISGRDAFSSSVWAIAEFHARRIPMSVNVIYIADL